MKSKKPKVEVGLWGVIGHCLPISPPDPLANAITVRLEWLRFKDRWPTSALLVVTDGWGSDIAFLNSADEYRCNGKKISRHSANLWYIEIPQLPPHKRTHPIFQQSE